MYLILLYITQSIMYYTFHTSTRRRQLTNRCSIELYILIFYSCMERIKTRILYIPKCSKWKEYADVNINKYSYIWCMHTYILGKITRGLTVFACSWCIHCSKLCNQLIKGLHTVICQCHLGPWRRETETMLKHFLVYYNRLR